MKMLNCIQHASRQQILNLRRLVVVVLDFDLEEDLQRLADYDAIELYIKDETGQVFIPYMMSDAVECYIVFNGCNIRGEWVPNNSDETTFSVISDKEKKGLVLRQGESNVITIWYRESQKYMECYQYHRIGHFWVEGKQEWRRLTYAIGTIHDKATFMGIDNCSREEIALIPLMEFAPFRYWTPLHESLDYYYDDTMEGIIAMKIVASKIHDKRLFRIVSIFEKNVLQGTMTARKLKKLANELCKCKKLYKYLNDQLDLASGHYQIRRYSKEEELQIAKMRDDAVKPYLAKGYEGKYPVLHKRNKKIVFYEEQPYVIRDFEYNDFKFKIQELKLAR